MNTKKAIWGIRPGEFVETSLHSLSWHNREKSSVFWVLGEEGTVRLSVLSSSPSICFVMPHTKTDRVVFHPERMEISFMGFKETIPSSPHSTLEMRKKGDLITFVSSDSAVLLTLSNPAFLSSAAFGVEVEGEGDVSVTVF